MAKYIFEGWENSIKTEDDGVAKIAEYDNQGDYGDTKLFVRFQSWDEDKEHEEFNKFSNRKVRITIETIDE